MVPLTLMQGETLWARSDALDVAQRRCQFCPEGRENATQNIQKVAKKLKRCWMFQYDERGYLVLNNFNLMNRQSDP